MADNNNLSPPSYSPTSNESHGVWLNPGYRAPHPSTIMGPKKDVNKEYQMSFLVKKKSGNQKQEQSVALQESRTTPLFSGSVMNNLPEATFSQYGLLAGELPRPKQIDLLNFSEPDDKQEQDPRIFLNVSAPWSAFICGSQGSGKSHTLSCMLENCLISSRLGQLPKPLTGLVFHYDKFSSLGSNQLCEAAYLCSSGIPTTVIVSPTNYWHMKNKYTNLLAQGKHAPRPKVVPLRFRETQLDVSRIMTLMAVADREGPPPLYIEVISRVLREMAMERKSAKAGIDYQAFKKRVGVETLTSSQTAPLKLRLELLESLMDQTDKPSQEHKTTWNFKAGELTIIDLSCPFVDESAACALFSICLELFLENRGNIGRVIALDEAHKYMTSSPAAMTFTAKISDIIRQQRHLASRVIIATQEPSVSRELLDLASMTIVHRFTSPLWLKTLSGHLAGAACNLFEPSEESQASNRGSTRDLAALFTEIVNLNAGEGLLFSPSAMLEWKEKVAKKESGVDTGGYDMVSLIAILEAARAMENQGVTGEPSKLGSRYVKMQVRKRQTMDGGRSIMAE